MNRSICVFVQAAVILSSVCAGPKPVMAHRRSSILGGLIGLGVGIAAANASRRDRCDRWEDRHGRHCYGDVCQQCGFGVATPPQAVVYTQPQPLVIYAQPQPQVVYQQPQPVAYQQATYAQPAYAQPQPLTYAAPAYAPQQTYAQPPQGYETVGYQPPAAETPVPVGQPEVREERVVKPDGSVVIRRTTTTRYMVY